MRLGAGQPGRRRLVGLRPAATSSGRPPWRDRRPPGLLRRARAWPRPNRPARPRRPGAARRCRGPCPAAARRGIVGQVVGQRRLGDGGELGPSAAREATPALRVGLQGIDDLAELGVALDQRRQQVELAGEGHARRSSAALSRAATPITAEARAAASAFLSAVPRAPTARPAPGLLALLGGFVALAGHRLVERRLSAGAQGGDLARAGWRSPSRRRR